MARPAGRPRGQAQIAGLRVAGFAALAVLGCANVEPPPGGPPDTAPPRVVGVRPESGAVVPGWKDDIEIQFDEVIDEMPGGGGGGGDVTRAGGLAAQVLLSPVAGGIKVDWHRSRITVRPRRGWQPGRVYRLELLPGILDLRRNRLDSGIVVLFSTGPAIGTASLDGLAVQWVEQRAIPRALIEAVPLPHPADSAGYLTIADSSGRFRLDGLTPGRYLVYGSADANGDRRRDRREPYDSAIVDIDSTAHALLFAFVHDTIGPRLRTATALDSLHARLEFTQALGVAAPFDTANVRVLELPDSTPVAVAGVLARAAYDSLIRQRRAEMDTAAARRNAADTTAQRRNEAQRGAVAVAAQQDTARARQDTTELRRILARRPVPTDRIVLRFAQPLKPDTRYLVSVTGATNLNGAVADGQAVLVTPQPPEPREAPPPPPQPPPPSPP